MYRATTSFTTNDYDVRYKEILEDNFTTPEQIQEFLDIGYIEVYDDTLEITENGEYDVEDYLKADVNLLTFPPKWNEIGYTDTPQTIIDGFNYAKEIYDNWDSSVTSMANKYINNTNLRFFPLVDTSKVTNLYQTFSNTPLEAIAQIDISRATNFTRTFQSTRLVNISNLNTQSATTFIETFQSCSRLVSISNINSSNSTSVHSMFNRCSSLVTAPDLDTSKVIDAGYFYYGCTKLKNVPIYNLEKITTAQNALYVMFQDCPALTDDSLNNIMASLLTAISYTGTKTLKYVGLSSTQATTCQTLSNWSALSEAGWSTGY